MADFSESKPRALIVHPSASTCRLIRETLEHFCGADVESCPDAQRGFELALQRRYQLFLFALSPPLMKGELLYDFIGKAYTFCHEGARIPPAIIYLAEEGEQPSDGALSEARVKGMLRRPINIERLLKLAKG